MIDASGSESLPTSENALVRRLGAAWVVRRLWPYAILIAVVFITYFWRLGELTPRGEETRWAQSAREMLRTGDWITPRQQGRPFVYRPPLGSWLIALTTLARGECDVLAIRLPTAIATLLTTLLVFGYARRWLTPLGALAAGLAYATMGQVLELGRLAETDSLFTLLLAGSLLAWHWLYCRQGATLSTWMVGYLLAALATLAKGPQAPVYFLGPTTLYLLWRRDWRGLFGPGQWLGLLVYLTLVGGWQAAVVADIGWLGFQQMWLSETAQRFSQHTAWTIARHLLTYPIETLLCTAPWSLLLVGFCFRGMRTSLSGQMRSSLGFLLTCLLVTFPTCWLPPGARGRYFMPLYPCMAVLVGMVVDWLAQTQWSGRVQYLIDRRRLAFGVTAIATAIGLGYSVGVVGQMIQTSEQTESAVAMLRQQLPENHRLVSFEPVHHIFAYHYSAPIELRQFPRDAAGLEDEQTFFCFDRYGRPEEDLPFAWEEVAVVSCDRNRKTPPQCVVVIGRIKQGTSSSMAQKASPVSRGDRAR